MYKAMHEHETQARYVSEYLYVHPSWKMDSTLLVSSHAGACTCIIDGLINAKLSTVQGFQLYAPSIHDRLRQDQFGRVLESFSRRNRQSEVTHQTDELRCSV